MQPHSECRAAARNLQFNHTVMPPRCAPRPGPATEQRSLRVKFQPDHLPGVNVISRLEPGVVWVNAQVHSTSVLVPWRGNVMPWAVTQFEAIASDQFGSVLDLEPELVLLGSGRALRFAPPTVLRTIIEHGIGVESMDTAAACRTFNVLATEGRRVVAALLLELPAP